MSIVILQVAQDSEVGFRCYGAAHDFFYDKHPEVMLSGAYETGKTIAALNKLHILLSLHPKSYALMVRKTYKSLVSSAVVTYEKKVLPISIDDPACPVKKYGGSRPEWYDYPNGSRLLLGGMDSPDKFLSAEFDFIYVNQAEELNIDDWEKLTGRATGRAGNAPYAQVMGDCNPDIPEHWIVNRERLKLFNSKHEDNPTLFDQQTGEITERGKLTLSALDALTGVRYKRGRLGLWVGREGLVYEEYDRDVHLIDRFEIPESWARYRFVDFGYTNPFVCQWWAEDEDGRLYLYREIYMTKRTVRVHAEQINRYSEGENILNTIADHDAEDRATLHENGISTTPANKDISTGIERVQERLKIQGDNRPRIFFLRDSVIEIDQSLKQDFKPTCTYEEITGYAYPETRDGKPEDEKPKKLNDHGMDAMRYGVLYLDYGKIDTWVY